MLSPRSYNARVALCLACPVTNRAKGYPFEVATEGPVTGVVLSDRPRSLAWGDRRASMIGRASARVLDDVREKLLVLLGG